MAQDDQSYMPYAPAAPVLNVVRRIREGRVPEPLTLSALQQLGCAAGNADRIRKTLQHLSLIDGEAHRTQEAERLARVSTEEYPRALAELVQTAYAPIFAIVDPATDTDIAIHDAFRGYEPTGQRDRMVGLFLALCREAALVEGGPAQGKKVYSRPRATAPAPRRDVSKAPASTVTTTDSVSPPEFSPPHQPSEAMGVDYRILGSLLQQLPRDGKWTLTKRNRWVTAVTANIDFLVEVVEETEGSSER